jgi:ABC-type spermidine/putrescine transport system permease subunit II
MLLSTENPQVMIAIAGVLCAIFGGVIAAFASWKNNTTLFKMTKLNICIIGILVGIALISLLPFMGLTCRWCTAAGS